MLKNFKATSTKAQPKDIQHPVGVSERIRSIVAGETAPSSTDKTPQENRGDVNTVLFDVIGSHGEFRSIPLNLLVPTPDEWNRFTPISDEKKVLMADSIYRNGLQQPIVVREAEDGIFQILAGNTRTEIYRLLLDLTHKDLYKSIPAVVYKHGTITDDQAREIVSDTNYIQRAELSKSDRAFAIHTKAEALRKSGIKKVFEKVAEDFNLKRSSAYYWDSIFKLIPEFFQLYENDQLDIKASARIGGFPENVQRKLYEERDILTNEIIMKIPANTYPELVIKKLHEIIDEMSRPVQKTQGNWSIHDTSSGYSITIYGKQESDRKPVLLFLPEKKLKGFMKKYDEYILHQD